LKINFGDIDPGESKLAWWNMVTSLDGIFTEFTGEYTHSSELGGLETSLIQSLNTHIILRQIDTGNITYDFLVGTDKNGLPDSMVSSVNGVSTNISSVNYTVTRWPTSNNSNMTIQTEKVEGKWIYISVEDPYNNSLSIISVVRSDGKILSPQNYWMQDGRILIVDDPTEEYTITYQTVNNTPVQVTNPSANPATILNDNGMARPPGTNITRLNVTVTGNVSSVTINLSPIGGSAVAPMIRIPGTDNYTITTNATAGINQINNLVVNASDASGDFNNSVSIPLKVLLRGDLNADGKIDLKDLLFLRRYLAGLEPSINPLVGDIYPDVGDGNVDLKDLLYLRRYLAGLDPMI
jgi:hypothetical protein